MKNPILLFVLYTLAEIAIFILVGKAIGVLPTLLVIVVTSLIGVYLLKRNGTGAMQKVKSELQTGQPPGIALIEMFMQFIGSICLIFPGFIANIAGVLMQFKVTRNIFKPLIFIWLRKKMKSNQVILYQK